MKPPPAAIASLSPAAMGDILSDLVIARATGKPLPPAPQIIAGHSVRVMRRGPKGAHGARVAVIDGAQRVPVELLPLTAGRDVWMREIRVRCLECRVETRAGDMECELCAVCYDKAGAENEAQDRGEG